MQGLWKLTTSGASKILRPVVDAWNLLIPGGFTLTGGMTLNGAVTLGDATSDDITVNGSLASDLIGKNAAGPEIRGNTAATSSVPTIIPNKADSDTGIGWAGANQLALIAGGVDILEATLVVGTPQAPGILKLKGSIQGSLLIQIADGTLQSGATNNSTTLTGTNTNFVTQCRVGDRIVFDVGGTNQTRVITVITSDTSLTVDSAFTGGVLTGKIINLLPAISIFKDYTGATVALIGYTGTLRPSGGTVGEPGFSFLTDRSTGIYSLGAYDFNVAVAGTQRMSVCANYTYITPQIQGGAGGVSAPMYSFTGDSDTGIYWITGNTIAAACGGVEVFRLNPNGLCLKTSGAVTASVTQTQSGGTALVSTVNNISVCANDNDTVTLPTAVAGQECIVINSSSHLLRVYPFSGDDLGAGVDTLTSIVSGTFKRFVAYDTTNWKDVS